MVEIEDSDTLILYSDGITEAANQNKEELGEQRIEHTMVNTADASPAKICQRILNQVIAFADAEVAPDDRTLVVIKFPRAEAALRERMSMDTSVGAVA